MSVRPVKSMVLGLVAAGIAAGAGAAAAEPVLAGLLKQRLRGGYMSQGMTALAPKMHAAGMNLAMPKFGGLASPPSAGDLATLAAWRAACADNQIYLMPVFNFCGGAEAKWCGPFRRYVDAGGVEFLNTPCPVDEGYWSRCIASRFVDLATLAKGTVIAGAIVDLEMYGADFCTYLAPCHCDACFARFLKEKQRQDPVPAATDRGAWLEANGLKDA